MSTIKIEELKKLASQPLAEAREILDAHSGDIPADRKEAYDKLMDAHVKAKSNLDTYVENAKATADMESYESLNFGDDGNVTVSSHSKKAPENKYASAEYKEAFASYLLGGSADSLKAINGSTVSNDPNAGYLSEADFSSEYIKQVDDATVFRGMARIFRVNNYKGIGFPELKIEASAEWGGEVTKQPETSVGFGRRSLKPHDVKAKLKASETLLRNTTNFQGDIIIPQLAKAHAELTENAFMNGDGVNKPLGVFAASDEGISTNRDIESSTSGEIDMDVLREMVTGIKSPYLVNAKYLMHRLVYREIANLKNSEGNYYVNMMGARDDIFGNLNGYGITLSEYAPSSVTAGTYAAIFGDFSNYWIQEALAPSIRVLDQLYAETNQIGYISNSQVDGAPMLEEAFIRLKIKA